MDQNSQRAERIRRSDNFERADEWWMGDGIIWSVYGGVEQLFDNGTMRMLIKVKGV
jgi:hypothetical protein